MSGEIDEVTIQYEEDGEVLVEEMEKVILHKGAWSTVMFLYREKDKKTGEFGQAKVSLRRFQKRGGVQRKMDTVNLTTKTAPVVIAKLQEWLQV
ncbi:MAG: hypothetical protein KQJ78_24250 [Deltaproteobacteria bacterium]|nr:hypothetical protein [Deltaproteobacteria bacterium]